MLSGSGTTFTADENLQKMLKVALILMCASLVFGGGISNLLQTYICSRNGINVCGCDPVVRAIVPEMERKCDECNGCRQYREECRKLEYPYSTSKECPGKTSSTQQKSDM
ncbi:hypothetical protein FGIG_04656 [Fasciola gigantica]|uniref:Uncharacterized protein n=1 Tax=Fasciola gigantica TaxID=46835 RepID=A0A504Y675_FASGI|nr:hypothetical protein FGIG_04656 [Fasciola gigantica]